MIRSNSSELFQTSRAILLTQIWNRPNTSMPQFLEGWSLHDKKNWLDFTLVWKKPFSANKNKHFSITETMALKEEGL